jgi:hypothetical protein
VQRRARLTGGAPRSAAAGHDDGFGRQTDYYQLLANTAALGLSEGLLVYCQHDQTAPPREITVRHLGTRLATWAVRLDRSPQHVEDELARLAHHIASRASAAGAAVA